MVKQIKIALSEDLQTFRQQFSHIFISKACQFDLNYSLSLTVNPYSMKTILIFLIALGVNSAIAQNHKALKDYKPTAEYDNIHVLKISEDDHQSSFIIWVKDSVPEHYHSDHTENIVVISGKATMTIDGKEITINKGDYLNLPEGTQHAVTEVMGHHPLKVLSIQTPLFSGKDRTFTKP
jgi:quercetin dioxygenase-like cupin family protein